MHLDLNSLFSRRISLSVLNIDVINLINIIAVIIIAVIYLSFASLIKKIDFKIENLD